MSSDKKISALVFTGISLSMVATVRSIPSIAATGWQMFVYLGAVFILYALPISLISGELGTAFPSIGGPQIWVEKGLGERWGFVTSCLLWAQVFPGLVMSASIVGPLVASAFGEKQLGLNHWFTLGCILFVFWAISLLNLKFDMANFSGHAGVWIGLYIPALMIFVLGSGALIVGGFHPSTYLGDFHWHSFVPTHSTIQYIIPIIFIFTGIETISVYAPRLKNINSGFKGGIFATLFGTLIFNLIGAFFSANVVPKGTIELTNIAQPIIIFCEILHLPYWIASIFSLLVAIGVIVQMSGWIGGPLKTIIQVAREGLFPPSWGFQNHNDVGISKSALLFQGIMVSLFALFFALPNVNNIFLVIAGVTMLIYCLIYILIALAFIRLRYTAPHTKRPFMVGRHGNVLAWIVTVIFITTLIGVIGITLYPQPWIFKLIYVGILVLLLAIPLWIYSIHKPDWLAKIRKWELQDQIPSVPLTVNNPGLFKNDSGKRKWWRFFRK